MRFDYAINARIICASKLLDRIENFSGKYNPAEIYNNFKIFNTKNISNSDPPNNSGVQYSKSEKLYNTNLQIKILNKIRIFKITDLNFDEICKLCIKS